MYDLTRLTPREREVLRLAADGLTNSEIAARLCLANDTVASYFSRIYDALGIRQARQEAIATYLKGARHAA